MKYPSPLALVTTLLAVSAGFAAAQPVMDGGRAPEPMRHEEVRDHHEGGHRRHTASLEKRAQIRLKKLGYYHGAIDGAFGRGSRAALSRFQRHSGLRPSGQLDGRTVRALGL